MIYLTSCLMHGAHTSMQLISCWHTMQLKGNVCLNERQSLRGKLKKLWHYTRYESVVDLSTSANTTLNIWMELAVQGVLLHMSLFIPTSSSLSSIRFFTRSFYIIKKGEIQMINENILFTCKIAQKWFYHYQN